MRLIVGLGNPGAQHSGNRHNVGFMAAGAIARRHGFSPAREKFHSLAAEAPTRSLSDGLRHRITTRMK